MRQIFLATLFIFTSFVSVGQKSKPSSNVLKSINNIEKAKELIVSNSKLQGKLFVLGNDNDTSNILEPLYKKELGYTFEVAGYLAKIVNVDSVRSLKVSYIYLDGTKLTKNQIDSIRNSIIEKYKSGSSFSQLAHTYNMDGNETGDLGWIREDFLEPKFVKAVQEHKKGEIFIVDSPELHWYHVVLKTHEESYTKILTVLRIKSSS